MGLLSFGNEMYGLMRVDDETDQNNDGSLKKLNTLSVSIGFNLPRVTASDDNNM